MILLDNKDNNPLIKHLQGEINIALADGKDENEINDIVSAIYPFLVKGYDYSKINRILTNAENFINRKTLTPLNLSVGEFRFVKSGLSVNNRNNEVYMDNYGIFYNKAYKAKIATVFDSYTDKSYPIEYINNKTPYVDGIFIMTGGIITNLYFNKAYLYKETVNKKSFYPSCPIVIETRAYTFNNEFILVAKYNNPKLKALFQLYDIPIKECNTIGYENFGITNKIKKDDLFKKRTSLGI